MPPKGKQNNKKGGKKPVPKKLNVPAVEWTMQTREQKAETIKEIKAKFGALALRGVEIVEMTETQHPSKMSMQQLTAVGACTDAQGKELAKFSNLDDVFDKFEVEISNVCVGTKMPYLVSAFDLDGKDHPILEDRRGKLVFIQFWAPWEERCQRQTAKVVELAAKRPEWAGKVCFLTVGCDTTLEKLKETLTSKSWLGAPNVTHLWSGALEEKEDADDIITKYELEDVPECMLIDGEGKLLKRADIEDFNVEVHLEKVLAGVKDYEGEPRPTLPNTFHALTPEARTALIDQVCGILKSDPGFSRLGLVTTEAKIHPVVGSIVDEEVHMMIMGKVDVSLEAKVAQIFKTIRDAHVSDLEQVVMVTSPPTPVEPQPACFICKKAFVAGEDVRWHCAMCPSGVTVCTPCINKDSKAPRNERSAHPHYHPWFRIGPQTTNDDLKALEFGIGRFGVALVDEAEEEKQEQRQPREDKPAGSGVVHEDVFCNGCEGAIADMPRWKCCSCEDFDFCDDCFGKHIQNTPAPKKAPKKKGAKGKEKQPAGHDQRHVFIRIDDSELVRIGGDDEDEGDEGDMDAEFDEGDMDLLAGALDGDLEGFDGTDAIVQKIRELNARDTSDEVVLTTSKGKPKIREVADEAEESEPEAGKGSDEDSEAEEEEKAKKSKRKPKAAAKGKTAQSKKKDGSDEDSEAEDTQLNQMAEEAAQVPLPEDDEDF